MLFFLTQLHDFVVSPSTRNSSLFTQELVGLELGANDLLGEEVGIPVGSVDGLLLGSMVGFSVGKVLGSLLGSLLGRSVGEADGCIDGAYVGIILNDGDVDGTREMYSMHTPHANGQAS